MLRSFAFLLTLLALSGGLARAQTCTLVTPATAATSALNLAFDVVNLSSSLVRITRIDTFLTTTNSDVQIWMVNCGGTHLGKTNQPGLWTRIANFPAITGLGTTAITPLPNLPTPVDIPPGVTGFYIFRTISGLQYDATPGLVMGTPISNDGVLEIKNGLGLAANFPAALPTLVRGWRGVFHYDCVSPGAPPPFDFQVNQAGAGFTIDSLAGGACSPTVVNKSTYNCTPPHPATGTIEISSNLIGRPRDLAMSGASLLPASGGGLTLGDGQITNLNLGSPLSFMNGYLGATWLGFGISGVTVSTLSVQFSLTTQTDLAFQSVFVDPSAGSGIRLSQASELHVTVLAPVTTVPIPLANNDTISISLATLPNCFPTGIPFYGTTYSIMHVLSNGRVMFGTAGDTTAAPTVALFASNGPSVGLWTDFIPSFGGGGGTATNVGGGVIRVDYSSIYTGQASGPMNSFGIEFDTAAGSVKIDGLTGVFANPQGTTGGFFNAALDSMLLGISRGSTGATDPGPTLFRSGGSRLAADTSGMWYDFYAAVNPGPGICASLEQGNLNSITFTPSVTFAPNYDWSGM